MASKIMWVSNPMIAVEGRACLVIIADQLCSGAAAGVAARGPPGLGPPVPEPGRASGPGARSERGHGRAEWRTLKLTAVAAGLAFPHAAQAIQVRRRRPLNGKKRWSAQTSYAVTSLAATTPPPPRSPPGFAATGASKPSTPSAMAPTAKMPPDPHRPRPPGHGHLRNLGIGILKPGGYPSIAAACRHHARDATRTLVTLGLSPA